MLVHLITYLFNLRLHQGIILNEWKLSIITSIYKKDSRDKPINYRSISLTVVVCYILESIIAEKIMDH